MSIEYWWIETTGKRLRYPTEACPSATLYFTKWSRVFQGRSDNSVSYGAVLCNGSRFLFAVRIVYLLKIEFKINKRKQKHVCISYW